VRLRSDQSACLSVICLSPASGTRRLQRAPAQRSVSVSVCHLLVPGLRDAEAAACACAAISDTLRSDQQGAVAMEAVQLVADLVKTKKCACDAAVVRAVHS
jgi:hypothetical protein